jgi:predicted nucleic acid-binding protein
MSAPLLVPDSGPLLALARVGLLHLPALLFSQVLVPPAVWDEVLRQPRGHEHDRLQAALATGQLTMLQEPEAAPVPVDDPRLGAGERAAIGLALESETQALIDERRGRPSADRAGLVVVGTVGLLVRGRQLGLIGPVRPAVDTLRNSGSTLPSP